jgi:hypothetical protein
LYIFYFKSVRLEIGVGLDMMMSFFRRVNACRLLNGDIYRGCVGIAPLILTLESVLSLVVSITQYLIKFGVKSPLEALNGSLARHFQENE